jgi:hypothetical protein
MERLREPFGSASETPLEVLVARLDCAPYALAAWVWAPQEPWPPGFSALRLAL